MPEMLHNVCFDDLCCAIDALCFSMISLFQPSYVVCSMTTLLLIQPLLCGGMALHAYETPLKCKQ